ncbi:hypothetical protein [Bacillus paranthracis]|nr:hypothetical protein [Bacillus paranthracis]UXR28816.1 hypothetical protein [Bacillus phage Nachito]
MSRFDYIVFDCDSCGNNHIEVQSLADGFICPVNQVPVYTTYEEIRL